MKLFDNYTERGRRFTSVLGALFALSISASALAEPVITLKSGAEIDLGLSAGLSVMSINNAHFGLGQIGANLSKDIARTEGYLAPRLNLTYKTDNWGTFYGELRAVGSMTRGDGDGWGLTVGRHWQWDAPATNQVTGKNMSYASIDSAYLGWKAGKTLSFLGINELDVSLGPQNFQLGDGVVLADGNDEANQRKGIYWLDPRQAWKNTAIVRIGSAPLRAELFALNSDADSYNDLILGGNLEIQHEKFGKFGASYFEVNNSELAARKGLSVTNVHGRGHPFPFLPTLELAGEVDFQSNSNPDVDAYAWFAEVSYFMPFLPWYPTIGYRYASFSGDKAGTARNEGWDYLHNGSTPRGFGYWYQGIVVGTYETRLSNLDTHFVNLTLVPPIKGSWVKIFYYDHRFNNPSTAKFDGTAVSSDRFATEVDLILGYTPNSKLDYIFIYGSAKPGQGGIERYTGVSGAPAYTSDKNETMIQFTLLVHF